MGIRDILRGHFIFKTFRDNIRSIIKRGEIKRNGSRLKLGKGEAGGRTRRRDRSLG